MIYLAFLAGVVIGVLIMNIIRFRHTSFGIIEVDAKNELCKVRLDSSEIASTKKKRVVLEVRHNVDLSHQ